MKLTATQHLFSQRSRTVLVLVALALALICTGCGSSGFWFCKSAAKSFSSQPAGQPLPDYDARFFREEGWTGADGDLSVALSDEVTLWLFGDSYFSEIEDNTRTCPLCFSRNSIALQRGKDPRTAHVEYFFGKGQDGEPSAFFTPPDGHGWLWPGHGIRIQNSLYLFLWQLVEGQDQRFLFGKSVGMWLAVVTNPDAPPHQWSITYRKVPLARYSEAGDDRMRFGMALVRDGDWIYVYGVDEEYKGDYPIRYLIVARVHKDHLADFDHWSFYSNGAWLSDWRQVTRGFVIASEFSVVYQPALHGYVAVYTENGLSKRILLRYAPAPYGPWSDPTAVFECPEMDWNKNFVCYGAKGHPELSAAPDELIVTYATNTLDGPPDVRLYWPRFLRVTFGSSGQCSRFLIH